MPTTVEVYRVESDNTTGAFLGFGSLLDPILIFLHPATTKPPAPVPPDGPFHPGPFHPGPIRPDGPIRPGPLRPDVRAQSGGARPQPDEPFADPAIGLSADAPVGPVGRARCRIRTDSSVLTIDGDVLPVPAGVTTTAPTVVQLDVVYAGDIDSVQVPQGPGHPTADEAADAVMDFVTEAALGDPAAPVSPPPVGPDVDDNRPHPGRRPWYCVICPGAFGC